MHTAYCLSFLASPFLAGQQGSTICGDLNYFFIDGCFSYIKQSECLNSKVASFHNIFMV